MTYRDRSPVDDSADTAEESFSDVRASKKLSPMITVIVIGTLMVAGGFVAYSMYEGSRPLAVGDCIAEADNTDGTGSAGRRGRIVDGPNEPRSVDCDDSDAVQVLGERPAEDDGQSCLDVDGVEAEMSTTRPETRILCLGPVGVDPSTSVNTVGEGECVVIEGEEARRADCGAQDAMRVLSVIEDVSTVPSIFDGAMAPCVRAGIDDAEMLYTWGLKGEYASQLSFDRGICLGEPGSHPPDVGSSTAIR